jgi:hypothetical protein
MPSLVGETLERALAALQRELAGQPALPSPSSPPVDATKFDDRPIGARASVAAIREAQTAGAKSLRQIAAASNARGIATARGGR